MCSLIIRNFIEIYSLGLAREEPTNHVLDMVLYLEGLYLDLLKISLVLVDNIVFIVTGLFII